MKNRDIFLERSASRAEAVWLAVIVVCVLILDPFSAEGRYAPKVAVLHTAGILAAATLALVFMQGASGLLHGLRCSAWTLTAFLASATLSQLWSVDHSPPSTNTPLLSTDLYALYSFGAIAITVGTFMRTEQQVRRLASVLLAISVPVSLLAILQQYSLSPDWFVGNKNGTGSFIGGPIYLAGYALMMLPLAVWQLHLLLSTPIKTRSNKDLAVALLTIFFLACAFAAPEKRGPTVGLGAATVVAIVLLGIMFRQRRWIRLGATGLILSLLVLASLSLLQEVGVPIRHVPGLGRLAMILPLGPKTGDQSRTALWENIPQLLLSPLVLPSGETDAKAAFRPLIGYGPNTVESVLPSKAALIDHSPGVITHISSHNLVWDMLISLGLVGTVAYFAFLFTVFHRAVQWLGLAPPRPIVGAVCAASGSILGGLILGNLYSPAFFALGTQIGFLVGIFLPLLASSKDTKKPLANERALLMVALLSAMAGHIIDMAFVFPVPATGLLFWVLVGSAIALSSEPNVSSSNFGLEQDSQSGAPRSSWSGILTGLILCSVSFSFIGKLSSSSWLEWALQTGPALIFLLAATSIFSGKIFSFDSSMRNYPAELKNQELPGLRTVAAFTIAACFAAQITNHSSAHDLMLFARLRGLLLPGLFVAAVFLLATRLRSLKQKPLAVNTGRQRAAALVVSFAAAALVLLIPVRNYQAAVTSELAETAPPEVSKQLFREALETRPEDHKTRLALADLMQGDVLKPGEDVAKKELLLAGLEISEFNPINARLGEHYLMRASVASNTGERMALAQKARNHLSRAARYLAQDEEALFNASIVEAEFMREPAKAAALKAKADAVTARESNPNTAIDVYRWSEIYASKAVASVSASTTGPYARRTLHYCERALQELLLGTEQRFWVLVNQGHALRLLGDADRAKAAYTAADSLNWTEAPIDPQAYLGLMEPKAPEKD